MVLDEFENPPDFVLWRPYWMRAFGKEHNGSQRKPFRFCFLTTLINVYGAEQGPGAYSGLAQLTDPLSRLFG